MNADPQLLKKIRWMLLAFITLLILSGITAFPLQWEFDMALPIMQSFPSNNDVSRWFFKVHDALSATNKAYPFLAYGTDWLAFAHIVIGVAFIGPYRDPVRNIWVIEFGMIACLMVFPLAFIAGPIRGIPFFWQLIDCSFGVFGFLLLYSIYKKIKQLEKVSA